MKLNYLLGPLFVLTSLCDLMTLVSEARPAADVDVVVVVVTCVVMTGE